MTRAESKVSSCLIFQRLMVVIGLTFPVHDHAEDVPADGQCGKGLHEEV